MLGALVMLWHGPEFAHELRDHLPWHSLPPWPLKVLEEPRNDLPRSTLWGLHMMHEPLKRLMARWALAYRRLMRLVLLTPAFRT